ncbi:MAG: molybdopterin-containing oxidoreductase family protein [Acidobacteriota bacterium]
MPLIRPAVAPPESHVETACPLDCPDACAMRVTLRGGRITRIDGVSTHEITRGYICAKVRRFHHRVYGDDRLKYPAVRAGQKGTGVFRRLSWDEALDRVASKVREVVHTWGAEAVLPVSYGGSNGLLTQDTSDATLFRRLGASRLLRTVCAAPTGAANGGLYGKMPSVSYQDFPLARLIILWGVNSAVSGIHLMPFLKEARDRGARLVVIDPRVTMLARQADLFLQIKPGTDLPVALAIHRHLFENGRADEAFLAAHTTGAERLREKAQPWTFDRAADISGIEADKLEQLAESYQSASPALVKCGWGLERNRNGGSAAAAVLALPAVAGKFGVRGGGYTMSNTAAWNIDRTWLDDPESATRAINMNHLGRVLTTPEAVTSGPPVKLLFVYNCNPAVTMPDQTRVLEGLAREDLFTVVFDQVLTDTAQYADVVLPATTFLEHYDVVRSYGPITLQLAQPVIEPVADARSNADVFCDLIGRLDLRRAGDPDGDIEVMLDVMEHLPAPHGQELKDRRAADAPFGGRPIQFVDVLPRTPDGKVHLFPEALDREAPMGLYGFRPDPATDAFPLALISPASDRTVSSTLGELPRPTVRLDLHPLDASARGITDGDLVRVFNAQGAVTLPARVSPVVRTGTVAMPKGVWRRHTTNGLTANALVPDALTDLGGGACFNDARVQVEPADR